MEFKWIWLSQGVFIYHEQYKHFNKIQFFLSFKYGSDTKHEIDSWEMTWRSSLIFETIWRYKNKNKKFTLPRLFSSYMLTQLAYSSIRDAKSLKVYLRSAEVNFNLSSIKSEQNKIY